LIYKFPLLVVVVAFPYLESLERSDPMGSKLLNYRR